VSFDAPGLRYFFPSSSTGPILMPTAMRVFSLASHIRSIPKHRRSPADRTGLYHKTDARLIFFRRPIYSRSLFFSIAVLGQKFSFLLARTNHTVMMNFITRKIARLCFVTLNKYLGSSTVKK
jgi:hypothetical protein